MHKSITDIRVGDIILDGGNRTTVVKIDREICKHKTHINDKDCWENFSEVRVQD